MSTQSLPDPLAEREKFIEGIDKLITIVKVQMQPPVRANAEVRIPRLLCYPRLEEHPSKRCVQLISFEYLDENTGAIKWFRFRDLRVAE